MTAEPLEAVEVAIILDALRAVKAAAWDEGYTVGNRHNGRRDDNPHRTTRTPGEETTP